MSDTVVEKQKDEQKTIADAILELAKAIDRQTKTVAAHHKILYKWWATNEERQKRMESMKVEEYGLNARRVELSEKDYAIRMGQAEQALQIKRWVEELAKNR